MKNIVGIFPNNKMFKNSNFNLKLIVIDFEGKEKMGLKFDFCQHILESQFNRQFYLIINPYI